jgi:hypothetical protein
VWIKGEEEEDFYFLRRWNIIRRHGTVLFCQDIAPTLIFYFYFYFVMLWRPLVYGR